MEDWLTEPHTHTYNPIADGNSIVSRYPWLTRYPPKLRLWNNRGYLLVKRIFDFTVVIVSAPMWLIVMGVCALLIKLDDPKGYVLFTQARTGLGGRRFEMYKFRSMVTNAEEQKIELAHLNELQWPDFKITNDPRITKIGAFLRKTSLDELPQIINVLAGEMSLVGPRPTSFSAETYALWHTERLDVLPGVTGLWQLLGRGKSEFDERLRMDITYIERRCLRLDIQIFVRTLFSVLQQEGAY